MSKTTPTVALAIIAKDEWNELELIVDECYGEYFDEIHIAYDVECSWDTFLKDRSNVFLHKYEWINDFAHKRNFVASKVTSDYYVRMDTDDTLQGAENIRSMCQRMKETGTDIVLCYYNYGQDESGNSSLAHYRETIIKNDKKLYWKKPVHENVVCDDATNVALYTDKNHELVVTHMADMAHRYESIKRNLVILEAEYEKDGDDTDPRTLSYLGRGYSEQGRHAEAIEFLDKHIKKSGWDEDRYLSRLYLAHSLVALGDKNAAKAIIYSALMERPDYPMAYGHLCEIFFNDKQYDKAVEWGKVACSKPQPDTNMPFDPSLIIWKIPLYMAISYLQLNDHKKALELFAYVYDKAANEPEVQEVAQVFFQTKEHYDYMNHLLPVIKFTKKYEECKMVDLVRSIPSSLDRHDMVADLKHFYLPPKKWADNSVVIYCGNTPHVWGPQDLETGIGGSEEATIHLSRQLVKLGYTVDVFLNCDEEVEDEGVRYIPFNLFNRNDEFANLIGWRQNIAMHDIKAKNHIMWIHDLPRDAMLQPRQIENLDKIIVLSEYHKSLLPDHAKCKAIVSTNGINPGDFVKAHDKVPGRMIYASSYDRGLDVIVKNWKTVKKAVPEAELHVYYGWNTYDEYVQLGLTDGKFKEEMLELFKQDGITEHGRIGHKPLIEEYSKSAVFAYPCNYTGEINCIALTKAIATNCNIVTNKFAILEERSPNAVDDDKFIDGIIEQLKLPVKDGFNEEYIKSMSWETVARQWKDEVL